jgi:DNA-binding NtrC family response regulator
VSADFDGEELDASLLSSLRGNIEKAAVPSVSVAHQVFLAEYYAKRGDLEASRRHSSLAESVLSSFPNIWLRGLLDLHQSCLSYLEGNYLDSLDAARHALVTSTQSGHMLTGRIAQADMAAAYLAVGQPARAKTCLSSALQQSNREEQIFGLLLETLAEAQLMSGDLLGCSESLRTARDLSARLSQSRSSWHRTWNVRTEARLLQRSGRWLESLSLIRNAGPRESPDSRSFTKAQLEALEALALAKLGKPKEARAVMRRFVQESLVAPKSYQGSILTASAALSEDTDNQDRAFSVRAHALRIVGATGEATSLVEIVDQLVKLVSGCAAYTDEPALLNWLAPLWRPTNIVCHVDASTPLLPSSRSDPNGLVAFLNSLADVTTDPSALGEEALRCLAAMDWIQSGSLIQTVDGESHTVVSFGPQDFKQAVDGAAETMAGDGIQVWLGSKQSRRYMLSMSPPKSDAAAANLFGFARLLASLHRPGSRESHSARSTRSTQAQQQQQDDDEGLFRSPAMIALLASAKRVAPLDITVLLTGESGTGKEVVARIIHRASGAPQDAFVPFNCATVPRDMVDSQLFGYRRGAFTGAVQGFKGVISAADGGTLLLDEVGELPVETQPKLLRFLDSGEVQALGEATPRKLRVRVVASTNADLERLVQEGRFREDLYYRLNVVRFRLSPLRERREEIAPLVSMFLSKYSSEFGKHNIRLSEAARQHLLLYSWPGNVRQLSHEVRRLVALSDSDSTIEVHDLDARLQGEPRCASQLAVAGSRCVTIRIDRPLPKIIQEVEGAAIADALEATDGRLDLAAKRLGLSRKGLYLKRQRLGFR